MTETLAPRSRKVKILATLGPASSDAEDDPPADARRRGRVPDQHEPRRPEARRPSWSSISARSRRNSSGRRRSCSTCRGPSFGSAISRAGGRCSRRAAASSSTATTRPATASRVQLPHAELFEAVRPGTNILIDDGKVRLNVLEADDGRIVSEVKVGGTVSDNKGVNVPDVRGADPGADRQGPRRPRSSRSSSAPTGSPCRSSSGPRTSPRRGR